MTARDTPARPPSGATGPPRAAGLVPPAPRGAADPDGTALGPAPGRPVPAIITHVPEFPQPPVPLPGDGGPVARGRAGTRATACARLDLADGRRLTVRGTVLLGRGPVPAPGEEIAQLITVRDPTLSVSMTHLALAVDDTGAWIVDRASTNGTVVTLPDGQQILCVAWRRVRVPDGARVRFGDASFVVVGADDLGAG